jgi:hypothetical protein
MRTLLIALACSYAAVAGDTSGEKLDAFGHQWLVQHASDWTMETAVLKLLIPGEPPPGQPRRPQKFAIAETEPFRRVTVDAEVRRNQRSVIIVYAWQDASHYNYAHISEDAAAKQPVHNGMFHIFGGERVRISALDGPGSLPSQEWTPVKLFFDGDSGRCYVEVNGKRNPSLDAYDLSLRYGRVGLGSFDETGDFRKVVITGEPRTGVSAGQR